MPSGCIIWTGCMDKRYGYGVIKISGKQYRAHRLALEKKLGRPIRPGYCACHDCPGGDNPSCVNPDHLWEGTRADNNRDRNMKGRTASGERHSSKTYPERVPRGDQSASRKYPGIRRGERNGNSRITGADIPDIELLRASGLSQQAIATRYGVTQETISSILRRDTWKHVPRLSITA